MSPGSDEAIEHGCICAVLDNGHGKGYMGMPGIFSMRVDCPLHGASSFKDTTEVRKIIGKRRKKHKK